MIENRQKKINRGYLLKRLASDFGYEEIMSFLEHECSDSVVPAICSLCETIAEGEADMRHGCCPHCEQPTLSSSLVLAKII